MPVSVDVQVSGQKVVSRRLDRMKLNISDLRPPMREAAADLRKHAGRMFATRGRAGGVSWPNLSPATLQAQARGWGYYRGRGRGPLQARGGLKRSYTQRTHRDHVEDIGRGGMEWGSSHNLAHLHAQGPRSRGPAPPLPSRPVLAFRSPRERNSIFRRPIEKHVLRPFRRGR